jgi:hypothetical protein
VAVYRTDAGLPVLTGDPDRRDFPEDRAELYEIAKQRDLPGRSKTGCAELVRALGEE